MILRTAFNRSHGRNRLEYFEERSREPEDDAKAVDWNEGKAALTQFSDRFGRAGFVTAGARKSATLYSALFVGGGAGAAFLTGAAGAFSPIGLVILAFSGAYLGLTAFLFFLRRCERDYEREILFRMPIFLESLVLLVESGLGILPALERVVTNGRGAGEPDAVSRLFHFVYQLSARGMPFGRALETVADASPQRIVRHVMLHLDITGSEGGELIPSLRSLSDHAHTEWKLGVEHRVRRLENLVVFPVFAAVIGLMILTAAVPAVPLLDLKDMLDKTPTLQGDRP